MTAASKGAVCPRLPGGGRRILDVPDAAACCVCDCSTYLMFRVSCRCCCVLLSVWSVVHCGVLCAAWWRAAITRLDTR